MADYNSDEERFTAIVDFLKRNQKSIMLIFSLVLFVAISSITFSTYRDNQNAQAAELYNVWFVGVAEEASDLKKIDTAYLKLQENFSKTGYAALARVIKGSQFARDGNFDSSLKEFNALLDSTSGLFGNNLLNLMARINIARIELSNKNYSNVLEVLEPLNSAYEHPMVYEVRGDALFGLQKNELALAQYNVALSNIQDESQKSLLKMKINKLMQ
jgi:predicted negative regulator of RcsB-dependent stress response